MKRNAIYPGTFDPITKGHTDVIRVASQLFDTVYVTLLTNKNKTPMFDLAERQHLIDRYIKRATLTNVLTHTYDGLTVDCAEKLEAGYIVRGLRLTTDYETELNIALNNHTLNNKVATVLIPPHQQNVHISSSVARELISFERYDCLYPYLHSNTIAFIKSKFGVI